MLASQGSLGSTHWQCSELDGWLGFRNVVSGRFLGQDRRRKLECTQENQRGQYFCVRQVEQGQYVLRLYNQNDSTLCRLEVVTERGVDRLGLASLCGSEDMLWEFIKV